MTTLEPSIALNTCETALREVITYSLLAAYGAEWLTRVSTDAQRASWAARAEEERRSRGTRGVLEVPDAGLAYANFYDLVRIADVHWEHLAPALGRKRATFPLLERFDDLRNAIGHNRPLLPFEQELLSGIAGQIRNQVTIYMSQQDPVGDIYPRIESISDSFGQRIESSGAESEVAGSVQTYQVTLHPGDVVTFVCNGVDPQGRPLEWSLGAPSGTQQVTVGSGEPATLTWAVQDEDVNETAAVSIYMKAADARYHRFGHFDHRAFYMYRVRPPGQ